LVNNRHSSIEIINKIVSVSRNGARKTEILYQSNLSYNQLQSYLGFLKDKEILKEEYVRDNGNSHTLYFPTDKGLVFLEDIKKVLEYLS
jgi:predicted transcriptional regulator